MSASWRFDAIGTRWSVESDTAISDAARRDVDELIARFDREWSRFRPDSLVAGLARTGKAVPVPVDAEDMLSLYAELGEATGGAVNPLVAASLEALGYDASYSLVPGAATAAPADWRALVHWNARELTTTRPVLIDVGALGKGRLVDLVHAVLAASVDGRIVVDAGGDIRASGAHERIGLEHPYDPDRIVGVVELRDGALCASATNRRAWGDGLHHVLDARTGVPVRTIAATWAIAPTAMVADAAATALFFDGGAEFAHRRGVEWVRMTTDGRADWSPNCRAELFT